MAIVIGQAGASARREWAINLFVPQYVLFVISFLLAPFLIFAIDRFGFAFALSEVLIAAGIGWYFWRDEYREILEMITGASNWSRGADGEALTGQALAALPDTYVVFHDFHPTKNGVVTDWNVDHIVIGPNGAFVIETKNYSQTRVPPASKSSFTKKNVKQTQRNAMNFKDKLKAWSGGTLGDVFVVPLLVYVQDGAFIERTREGEVQVIPLKWLENQISRYSGRRELNPDEIYRIASVMFHQMEPYMMDEYRTEIDRFGAHSRRFKLDRAAGRGPVRDTSTAKSEVGSSVAQGSVSREPSTYDPSETPTVCPNCGGRLFERKARQGNRAGKRFLGCENYHNRKCRFTHNLEA